MKKATKKYVTLLVIFAFAVSLSLFSASARNIRSSTAEVFESGAKSDTGTVEDLGSGDIYGRVVSTTADTDSYVIGSIYTRGVVFTVCRAEKTADNENEESINWTNVKGETGHFWAECERVGSHGGYCYIYQH